MDRDLWKKTLSKHSCPPWICTTCKSGHIRLVKDSLRSAETVDSKKLHGHEAWDPEWIDLVFVAWAKCSNEKCNQEYAISGAGGYEPQYTDHDFDYYEYFTPKFISPMPDIIEFPKRCPEDFITSMRSSFSLYYRDNNSCAGKIGVALELLMDHLKIPTHWTDKKKKSHRYKLHERIEKYKEYQPEIARYLLALKWLRNTAVHENEDITREDVLDAFEIIEHALIEIIEQRSKKIAKLAEKLTAKHSPTKA